ncbi:MAG: Do family serine endopeptidase [Candidatus Omnitrophota bacterium]|nr:MAG: Do family serine endopeptidase [Candidatus Omnitrophota bacterium]
MKKGLLCVLLLVFLCFSSQASTDLEDATIKVARQTGKAVVSISSTIKEKIGGGLRFGSPFGEFQDDFFQRFFEEFFGTFPEKEYKRMGLGSGVIIDKDGYILTNEHVISGASEIKVKLSDGREFDAEVKGTDKRTDLAVIKIDARNLPVAQLGNSDSLQIGAWVVAIVKPFGFAIENPEPTVTVGVVSALGRYVPALGRRQRSYDDLIQTDAAINPGNSGGPLVNLKGEIIGINTAIITTSGGYQGLGFAIPINKAKRILQKLIRGEKVLYGWLGVTIQDLNEDLRNYFGIKETEGVIVIRLMKDSPADKSGFKEGDLILTFDDKSVKATRDLVRMVSSTEVGTTAPVKILRDGKEIILKVKIGKRPEDIEEIEGEESEASFRGIEVDDITAYNRQRFKIRERAGVIITNIEDDSPAEKSGLRVGDVIIRIEGRQRGKKISKKVHNKEDFISIASQIKGDCLITTNRGYFLLKER